MNLKSKLLYRYKDGINDNNYTPWTTSFCITMCFTTYALSSFKDQELIYIPHLDTVCRPTFCKFYRSSWYKTHKTRLVEDMFNGLHLVFYFNTHLGYYLIILKMTTNIIMKRKFGRNEKCSVDLNSLKSVSTVDVTCCTYFQIKVSLKQR